jgi:hypothetical protein
MIGNRAFGQVLARLRHYDDDADLPEPRHYDDDADLPKPRHYDDDADLPKPRHYDDDADLPKPRHYDDGADLVVPPTPAPAPKPKGKYKLQSISQWYLQQDLDAKVNTAFAANQLDTDLKKHGPGIDKAKYLKEKYGWTLKDYERYYVNKEEHRVRYMGAKQRREYRVRISKGVLTEGESGAPMDTAGMSSKFAGPGYGIFVLSPRGRLYVGQHKIGVIHHSSFLAGKDVAGAGEIKIVDGRVEGITNKSGHYQPHYDHLRQTLKRLRRGGVAVDAVPVIFFDSASERHYGVGSEILKMSEAKFVQAHP